METLGLSLRLVVGALIGHLDENAFDLNLLRNHEVVLVLVEVALQHLVGEVRVLDLGVHRLGQEGVDHHLLDLGIPSTFLEGRPAKELLVDESLEHVLLLVEAECLTVRRTLCAAAALKSSEPTLRPFTVARVSPASALGADTSRRRLAHPFVAPAALRCEKSCDHQCGERLRVHLESPSRSKLRPHM